MSTKDTDKGRFKLKRLMAELKSSRVAVGALDDKNAAKLAYAEYGTETAPARPVVRTTLDANAARYGNMAEAELDKAIQGNQEAPELLNNIGKVFAKDLQAAIIAWSSPPNAASTVAKKGKNDPLVDSGDLVQSIKHKVIK